GIEARSKLEQRGDAPLRNHAPCGGWQYPANDLQKCALAAAVRTHYSKDFAALQAEADIPQGPEISVQTIREKRKNLPNAIGRAFIQAVQLGDVLNTDHG